MWRSYELRKQSWCRGQRKPARRNNGVGVRDARIVQRGGWRIAIVGLPIPADGGDARRRSARREDGDAGEFRVAAQVTGRFIVLLAFTDEVTLHALAKEFYELDVILGEKRCRRSNWNTKTAARFFT
jgi:hypothetical protein